MYLDSCAHVPSTRPFGWLEDEPDDSRGRAGPPTCMLSGVAQLATPQDEGSLRAAEIFLLCACFCHTHPYHTPPDA